MMILSQRDREYLRFPDSLTLLPCGFTGFRLLFAQWKKMSLFCQSEKALPKFSGVCCYIRLFGCVIISFSGEQPKLNQHMKTKKMNSSPLYSLHHGRFHERKSSFNLNRKSKQLRKDGMFPRLCMSFLPFLRKQNLPLYIKQLTKGFGLSSSEGCFYISNFPNCARHTNCGFTFPMTCPGG